MTFLPSPESSKRKWYSHQFSLCITGKSSSFSAAVPNVFDTKDWFHGRQFFYGWAWGDGFRMIQMHYIYCTLDYYYISSTSDHQALDPRVWGLLIRDQHSKIGKSQKIFFATITQSWKACFLWVVLSTVLSWIHFAPLHLLQAPQRDLCFVNWSQESGSQVWTRY